MRRHEIARGVSTPEQHHIPVARCREVAARHQVDVRTLSKAMREGPSAVRGMAADRCRAALHELGLSEGARG